MGLPEDDVALLGELASALHQATLPADVVEERLAAVARRLGMEGEFFTLQSFVAMELHADGGTTVSVGRLQLAPGFLGTRVILHLLRPHESAVGAADGFLQIFVIALQLGIGLLVADLLFRRRRTPAEGAKPS